MLKFCTCLSESLYLMILGIHYKIVTDSSQLTVRLKPASSFVRERGIFRMRHDNRDYEEWKERLDEELGYKPKRRAGGILKKAILLIAGGILFGSVAGVVMVGINIASSDFVSNFYSVTQDILSSEDGGRLGEYPPFPGEALPATPSQAAPASDVSAIVEKAMPSVVAITSTALYQSNPFGYGWFFGGGQTYEVPSSGSGIIIGENDKEILIVTNNHVVEDSSSLKVAFIDDTAVDAAIKGTDYESDLAVIAVPLENIPDDTRSKISIAKMGDSNELKVGQGVVAIGNALGYGQSVTVGYVSALNREVRVSENQTRKLLQTDAAINPGNSGGALLNMKGEVIGINAAKYSDTNVEGMGYAIPISEAEEILGQLMTRKTRNPVAEEKRGYLGIQGTTVDQRAAQTFGMPEGVYVYKIVAGGAAEQSDLKEKDIITKVDGQTVSDMTELQNLLSYYEAGEQAELTVQTQENGEYKEHTVMVTLAPMPEASVE